MVECEVGESLSFYRSTPPCGGVPVPGLGGALGFRRSGGSCLLPSAGGLWRARVSSPGSVFDPPASFRGDTRRTWWWRVRSRASLSYVLSERVLRSFPEVVSSFIVQEPLVSFSLQ